MFEVELKLKEGDAVDNHPTYALVAFAGRFGQEVQLTPWRTTREAPLVEFARIIQALCVAEHILDKKAVSDAIDNLNTRLTTLEQLRDARPTATQPVEPAAPAAKDALRSVPGNGPKR